MNIGADDVHPDYGRPFTDPDYGYLFTLLMVAIAMALFFIAGGALLLVFPVHHCLVDHVALRKINQ
jgi:hypothetical protein